MLSQKEGSLLNYYYCIKCQSNWSRGWTKLWFRWSKYKEILTFHTCWWGQSYQYIIKQEIFRSSGVDLLNWKRLGNPKERLNRIASSVMHLDKSFLLPFNDLIIPYMEVESGWLNRAYVYAGCPSWRLCKVRSRQLLITPRERNICPTQDWTHSLVMWLWCESSTSGPPCCSPREIYTIQCSYQGYCKLFWSKHLEKGCKPPRVTFSQMVSIQVWNKQTGKVHK